MPEAGRTQESRFQEHSPWRQIVIFSAKVLLGLLVGAIGFLESTSADEAGARAFERENDAAMSTMMMGMSSKPTGDIDRDFAVMMIAHHHGAVDMALAELRHGGNERLRRLAQEIVIEQRQEIAAMQQVLERELPVCRTKPLPPPSKMAPAPSSPQVTHTHYP